MESFVDLCDQDYCHEGSEEGEILDTEEEQILDRIQELEAENLELEKIARISQYRYADYNFKPNSLIVRTKQIDQKDVARIPSDASLISSDEFEPIKKVKRKKRPACKEHQSRFKSLHKRSRHSNEHENHRCKSRRHKSKLMKVSTSNVNHKKHIREHISGYSTPDTLNDYLETISLESNEDSYHKKSTSNSDSDTNDIDNSVYLNREKLRFALARDKFEDKNKTKNLLKERLCNNNTFVELKRKDANCKFDNESQELEVEKPNDDLNIAEKDDTISQEEQELRLIALKSAVLKKHLARKKRNAEVAYSPTDFEPTKVQLKAVDDDNMDVVEDELNELEDVMEISPIASPKLALSPFNEDTSSCNAFFNDTANNISVDMDIVSSEQDDEEIYEPDEQNSQTYENQWCPIYVPPITATTPPPPLISNRFEHPLPLHYGIYVPEMQYQISPYVDDDNEEPPPPPPFNMNMLMHNETNTMERHSVFQRLGEKTNEIVENCSQPYKFETQPQPPPLLLSSSTLLIKKENCDSNERESDEEASALRAVLLSRLKQKKQQKETKKLKSNSKNEENVIESTANGIDSVLQKALRRLKSNIHSKLNEAEFETAAEMCSYIEDEEDQDYNKTPIHNNMKEDIEEENLLTPLKFMPHYYAEYNKSSNDSFIQNMQSTDDDDSIADGSMEVNISVNKNENIIPKSFDEDILENEIRHSKNITNESNLSSTKQKSTIKQVDTVDSKYEFENSNENKVKEKSVEQKANVELTRKRNASKAELSPPIRTQPLSVKNTLNQVSSTPPMPQQSQLPIKKIRRTTKIVRRNKVINKEVTTSIKRDAISAMSSKAVAPALPAPQIQSQNTQEKTTNMISSKNLDRSTPKIAVKKLIINLRASETETSDEEFSREIQLSANNSVNRLKQVDDIYSANASPLELLINSTSCSPANGLKTPPLKKSCISEAKPTVSLSFEKKLDSFLKNIRAKQTPRTIVKTIKHSPIKHPVNENSKILNTPLAVRHLPLSSQDEYRRLVNRMKSLEKQKQAKKSDTDERTKTGIPKPKKKKDEKETQINLLNSYENSFNQTSENIVALLNQSLSLVAEAKRSKLIVLQHEKRLNELRAEMDRLNAESKQEDLKLDSMKPHLEESHQFLIRLNKKRKDLLQNANKLGKAVKGDDYSLNTNNGEEIFLKSKKLQTEIKLVNSLNPENFEQVLSKMEVQKKNSTPVETAAIGSDNRTSVKNQEQMMLCEQKHCHHDNIDKATKHDPTKEMKTEGEESLPGKTNKEISLEPYNQNVQNDNDDNDCIKRKDVHQDLLPYISPLEHLRNTYGYLDFNAIVCPYEMWGKCADTSCKYMHMTLGKEKGTELIIKPLKK